MYTNEVIMFGPAGSVAVGMTPWTDLAGDVAVDVVSPADLAGVVFAGVASSAVAEVAAPANLAGDVTVGVASSAVAEVASSADLAEVASLADLAGDVTIGVPSSTDPADFVTAGVALREECGDGVVILGNYDCVCDDFAEVASLAEHAGGVTVDMAPSADTDIVFAAGMSYVEQCQECGGLPKSVKLLPADKDTSFVELKVIVVGAVGMGVPWFLTGWAEGTEVEFMNDAK